MAQTVKHLPTKQETWVRSLGQEDPGRTEEPGGLHGVTKSQTRLSNFTHSLQLNNSCLVTQHNINHMKSGIWPFLCTTWKVKVKVLVAQSGPILCPPGSSVHGILQASILEGVAIPFSRGSYPPRDWTRVSCSAGRFLTIWATRESSRQPAPRKVPAPGRNSMSVCGPNERGNVSSQLHGEASLIRPLRAAKEHPQLSTSDLQTSSLGYCLLSSRWSWTELLVREEKKKNTLFFSCRKIPISMWVRQRTRNLGENFSL